MFRPILIILLLLFSLTVNAQSNLESDRIAELYELIPNKSSIFGIEVSIFDYKIKGKKIVKDSTLRAKINIVDAQELTSDYEYDTLGSIVTKYELVGNKRLPSMLIKHDNNKRVIEKIIVNEEMEELSKTFYTYENNNLISEEAYTGYAYLDVPRKLSLITYRYEGLRLLEKEKKYSLNGIHWIQTWLTTYNDSGQVISLQETNDEITYMYKLHYNEQGRIVKYAINSNDINSIKEVSYTTKGNPASIYWYTQKKKRPIRLTRYYYRSPKDI